MFMLTRGRMDFTALDAAARKSFFEHYAAGYADIMLTSPRGDIGVVIEIKASKSTASFQKDVEAALNQIQDRKYAVNFISNSFAKHVYGIGIACCGKSCSIGLKVLKGGSGKQSRRRRAQEDCKAQ